MQEHNLKRAVEIFQHMQINDEIIAAAKIMAMDLKIVFQHPGVGTKQPGYGTMPCYAAMALDHEEVRIRTFDLLTGMVMEKQQTHRAELHMLGVELTVPLEPPKQIEDHTPTAVRQRNGKLKEVVT